MRIPKYWKKADSEEIIGGKKYLLTARGYSDLSEDDAFKRAKRRLVKIRDGIASGAKLDPYEYNANPIREQRIETFGSQDDPFAIITRNGYGSRVLNTSQVMFVDIDFGRLGFFEKLFGGKNAPRDNAVKKVEKWLERNRWAGFRIYETPAGLRLIATDKLYDPTSDETSRILEQLQSDVLYRRLCKSQKCFRARISPKPWRIGMERCPIRYPEDHTAEMHRRWCDGYESKAASKGSCRFLKSVGRNVFNSEIERIITIHDEHSKALEDLHIA